MSVPTLTPTLKPFREALAFHRSRVPMTPAQFAELSNEAKLRAFTVSGLARQASVVEAYRLAEEAQTTGMTMQQFRERLTSYLLKNDGALLADSRIDLIFRQAITTARSVGRYEQMTAPEVLAARPYWMYSLGPDDDRTTPVCERLQGFVAPAKSEVWNHIYPPNHFNERHSVVSLSTAQAKSTGRIYEGPDDEQYPFIDDRRVFPDPGFDVAPNLLASDGEQLLAEIANLGDADVLVKTPADYGLPKLRDLAERIAPEAPDLTNQLHADRTAAEIESAWSVFRAATGIAEGEQSTILVDAQGDGVVINRQTFDHIVGEDTNDPSRRLAGADRAQFFNFFRPTIEDPLEIWFSPKRTDDGEIVFTKVYIGLYRDAAKTKSFQVFLVRSPQGWLMFSGYPRDPSAAEALRRGFLSFRSYGRSTN